MADRLWRAQVTIPLDSGVPEDAIVNTLYFDDDDDPIADEGDTRDWIMILLTAFYNAIDGFVFPNTVGANATVRLYDMADAEPRVPLYTETIALTPYTAGPMVNEVAICASFAAQVESGDVPARKRGRIFLGPVTVDAGVLVGSQVRPTTSTMDAIRDAMDAMADGYEHPASPGYRCRWAVYSPKTDELGTLGEAFSDVVRGWVDDAFDTQRRRGPVATTRLVFP